MDVTIGVYRASTGGYVGGGHVHPALLDAAREELAEAKASETVTDGYVARCGDDIDLVLMMGPGGASADGRGVAHAVFGKAASASARLCQHGPNGGVQLSGVELSFVPRPTETVLCLFTNKAAPDAFDLLLYRAFADPFVTPALVTETVLREGFRFVVTDRSGAERSFDAPGDLYRLLEALSGATVTRVVSRSSGETAAVVSPGPAPILVVRAELPFPGVEDVLEAFVAQAGVRSLVPVSGNGDAAASSVPRAMGLGFQVTPGRLVGPRDLLGDSSLDDVRRAALAAARSARSSLLFAGRRKVHTAL